MVKTIREKKATPLMGQYNTIKGKHPDALLLFRVGDFYETFGEDAIKTSKILGIVLTNRANGSSKTELAGFPYHSLDTYLPKLVRSGQRVAICDQLEDPKATKKIVKRGVTELVTPGVSYNDLVLETKKNNFLASLFYGEKNIGISFLDISTGEFLVAEGNIDYVDKLLQRIQGQEARFFHVDTTKDKGPKAIQGEVQQQKALFKKQLNLIDIKITRKSSMELIPNVSHIAISDRIFS